MVGVTKINNIIPSRIVKDGKISKVIKIDNKRVWWYPARETEFSPDWEDKLPRDAIYDFVNGYYSYKGKQISDIGIKYPSFGELFGGSYNPVASGPGNHRLKSIVKDRNIRNSILGYKDKSFRMVIDKPIYATYNSWFTSSADHITLFHVGGNNQEFDIIVDAPIELNWNIDDSDLWFTFLVAKDNCKVNLYLTKNAVIKIKISGTEKPFSYPLRDVGIEYIGDYSDDISWVDAVNPQTKSWISQINGNTKNLKIYHI